MPEDRPSVSPFLCRHLGVSGAARDAMARELGFESLASLIDAVVPADIRLEKPLGGMPAPVGEIEALEELREIMGRNQIVRSLIGLGYSDCITPPVIQRNILENPGWYTAYTPYQAEIAQGRMEALMNFQTMVCELTGLDVANASLLDEGTAAAEAVSVAHAGRPNGKSVFVSAACHPQTVDVVRTRCEPLGIEVIVGDHALLDPGAVDGLFAVLVQYPATDGAVIDYGPFLDRVRDAGATAIVAADLLALTILRPPGEFGADIAVGSAQRFGVPLGFGGPHAGFMAVRDALKRRLPGRLIGVSHDADGRPSYRLSLQTREQHIRRDKATSNICTAQVLLAVMASTYAVYHGPDGLRAMAERIRGLALRLRSALARAGMDCGGDDLFDTVTVSCESLDAARAVVAKALEDGFNLRDFGDGRVGISLDERSTPDEVVRLAAVFGAEAATDDRSADRPSGLARTSEFLRQAVFHRYRSETELLRYLHRLESRDLALNSSMIPLGSCTMKLNATVEMMPLSWREVSGIHPFVPPDQAAGYLEMIRQLEAWLAEATGFDAVSLQPNAGSQGEYAGLLAIRRWHLSRGDHGRDICLIPTSAHGTNPASAVMAGMKVVPVACTASGDIDVDDLNAKAEAHSTALAALMVTYPSTHGVFESRIAEVCRIVHQHGGQVYLDGANMNAQVGFTSPGRIGADVCHLNLHKTFCIPHGGGGPGVGPIGVRSHLAPFVPGHRFGPDDHIPRDGAVCSAPFGSASICTISWIYIRMLGAAGLTEASATAILNANYVAKRLDPCFPVLYRGNQGLVAHECIVDLRPFKAAGIEVEDVAKRLMDYGFHAPTMSWPVPGTMMIEPTESESRDELDRFCEAMIRIHGEIMAVKNGEADAADNPLKNAPHPAHIVCSDAWNRAYSRESAAFPAPWLREHKFWPPVSRIDNVYGDRHLVCTCDPVDAYAPADS